MYLCELVSSMFRKKVSYLCFPARIFLDQTPGERGGAAEGREQGPNHITQSVSDQFLEKGVHRKIMMWRERGKREYIPCQRFTFSLLFIGFINA